MKIEIKGEIDFGKLAGINAMEAVQQIVKSLQLYSQHDESTLPSDLKIIVHIVNHERVQNKHPDGYEMWQTQVMLVVGTSQSMKRVLFLYYREPTEGGGSPYFSFSNGEVATPGEIFASAFEYVRPLVII